MGDQMQLQLDLACAIVRIEQANRSSRVLRDFLIDRLATCDARRLRGYLDEHGKRMIAMAEEMDGDGGA